MNVIVANKKQSDLANKSQNVYFTLLGDCSSSECKSAIKEYAKTIGYSTGNNMSCPARYKNEDDLYCVKDFEYENRTHDRSGLIDDMKDKRYYRIITKINIEIPIINNILDLRIFYITGDTKTFEK